MPNQFESSRVAEGTLQPGSAHVGATPAPQESRAVSRDDVRDGLAAPGEISREGNPPSVGPEDPSRNMRRVVAASRLTGDRVRNNEGQNLGTIEEITVDTAGGRIAYAVLSFGGFLGIGDKLFAVPWASLKWNQADEEFILDVDRTTLESAPGFDKSNWPDLADPSFGADIHKHYGQTPWWEHTTTDAGDFTGEEHVPDRSRSYEPTTGYRAR